jgi:predicted nucleic acid-binding protein
LRTFLDASAMVKRYIDEAGTDSVLSIIRDATEFGLSVLCRPEVISALCRRVRQRDLTRDGYAAAKAQLALDVAAAAVVRLSADVLERAIAVMEAGPLKAADAIHVASAVEWGAELFVSADRQQLTAARKAGLKVKAA